MFEGFRTTSPYGPRIHPITKVNSFHTGIDLVAPRGAAIKAFVPGVVHYAGWGSSGTGVGGYGNVVLVKDEKGALHMYAHLRSVAVEKGQTVSAGTVLGIQGTTGVSTGDHLHYEVRTKSSPSLGYGSHTNPTDYLKEMMTVNLFYVDGEPLDVKRIVQDGTTLVELRPVLTALGIPVHWDQATGNTYVGKLPEVPMNLFNWSGQQAIIRGNLLLAKGKSTDLYHRLERTTPYRARAFDGVNGVFFNMTNYGLAGVAHDKDKTHCTGASWRPPRACLVVYKDGTCEVVSTNDFIKDFPMSKRSQVHLAIGGYSADPEVRKTEGLSVDANLPRVRTFVGYRGTEVVLGVTRTGMTLAGLEQSLSDVFASRSHWINLDGGGSTGAYFYNGGKPLFVSQSRIVPSLLGIKRG